MPESLIFGQREFDGPTALYALYDYVSTGKRGAHGTLIPDDAAGLLLSVDPQTIAVWRRSLVDLGLCRVERDGRSWRKHVARGHHAARFVLVPAIVVRALLHGHVTRAAFRTWALLVNERVEQGRGAGTWRPVAWIARQLGGRDPATVSALLLELHEAGLLRVDDFGLGHPRRLVPLHARPVTQELPRRVREAAARFARRVGLLPRGGLRRPRLAGGTPPADQGHAPPPNHGYPGSRSTASQQLAARADAPSTGRDLVGDYLPTPPLDAAELASLPSWLRERVRQRVRMRE